MLLVVFSTSCSLYSIVRLFFNITVPPFTKNFTLLIYLKNVQYVFSERIALLWELKSLRQYIVVVTMFVPLLYYTMHPLSK